MKTYILFATVILNALSTGFFFAWSVSVILGTKKVGDLTYLETMQSINREILNPVFFTVFFGSMLMLFVSAYLQYSYRPMFWFIIASAIVYLIGTFGVTAIGNVPLNNELETLNLKGMSLSDLKNFRTYYESNWNRYHLVRAVANLGSFILLVISIFIRK